VRTAALRFTNATAATAAAATTTTTTNVRYQVLFAVLAILPRAIPQQPE
jgi:hypothetical protein